MTDAHQALEELKASILFEAHFPRRERKSARDRRKVSDEQRQLAHRASVEAIELARSSCSRLEELIEIVGKERHQPAVPVLAELWHNCAHLPVRCIVGHALFDIGSPDALEALIAMLDDRDSLSRFLAIKAVFARDAQNAYDFFADRFAAVGAGEDPLTAAVLGYLGPSAFRKNEPLWFEGAEGAAALDERWLELAASLRKDRYLGDSARDVLRYAPAEVRDAALARARTKEALTIRPAVARTLRNGTLLARYEAGAYEAVWREIRSHQAIAGDFREEVLEVAKATMRRVADNADLLTERLRARGWRALLSEYSDLRTPPHPDDAQVMERIREMTESQIPPSLEAFWCVVGGINWVWDYRSGEAPDLGVALEMIEMDPLCVDPPKVIRHEFEVWLDQKDQPDPDLIDPFRIVLAPDVYHKANFGGGEAYAIVVPCAGADPIFDAERHELPFIDYLRLAFRWAGFPGLESHARRTDVQRFLKEFGRGLLPF